MRRDPSQPQSPSFSRLLVAIVLYLSGFAGVLMLVCWLYLFPAIRAAASAIEHHDPRQKKELAATASLVLVVVLFVLFAGLLLAFRMGRFFFPRPQPPRAKPTEYSDAWEESGRRMNVADLPRDDEEE
jgi:Trk-type K+ transport system membrane component